MSVYYDGIEKLIVALLKKDKMPRTYYELIDEIGVSYHAAYVAVRYSELLTIRTFKGSNRHYIILKTDITDYGAMFTGRINRPITFAVLRKLGVKGINKR